MMLKDLLLATNNDHKHREFLRLFPPVRVRVPREVGLEFEFEENGETFVDNALGKALALYQLAGVPVIADDSGLCVDALDGAPGVLSNRFGAGPDSRVLPTTERNQLLLDRMADATNRGARFVCCLALVLDRQRFFVVQETVEGTITHAPRGAHGFGYDPLFLLPALGLTMAEISDQQKDVLSHRGRAAQRIRALLEDT
jgi:XTP/dITP diphosphohydrolase